MSFGAAVGSCLRKYASFSGRARRSEYWWWMLFFVLCYSVATGIDASAGLLAEDGTGVVNTIAGLALTLPGIAVTVRRLHDTGRSGWFCLLSLVPLVGPIVMFVFTVTDSQRFNNPYGPSPKPPHPARVVNTAA